MGNCLGSEVSPNKKTQEESPTVRELNYLDQQNATASGNQAPRRDAGEGRPYMQPVVYPGSGFPPVRPYGYGLDAPMLYPRDPRGGYYQPRGPLLLMDPYTGATYEYEEGMLGMYTDNERRHRRRKERQKTSSRYEDEDKGDDGGDEDDERRHRHRSSHNKPTENGGVVTSPNVEPSTSKSENVTSAPKRQRSANYQPRDVMISYSRTDKDVMKAIKDKLEARGISVWVDVASIDAGADFLSKIGEAIIDAKLFVCILSEKAVKSKYCRDEVALAYVSNTAVFPVNLQPKDQLLPLMDTGLKLQLANYNWTSLTDPDTVDANIDSLVSTMKAELDDLRQLGEGGALSPAPAGTSVAADGGEMTSPSDVVVGMEGQEERSPPTSPVSDKGQTWFQGLKLRERNRAMTTLDNDISHIMPEKFWTDRFGLSDDVPWDRFKGAFLDEFRGPVEKTFSADDQHHLMDILKRELEVDDEDRIFKYSFLAFCSVHGEAEPVWQRVEEQARESFAMREVFDMDSSVRVEAIENLGKFRSAAVIDALRDLLKDPDANVRAVATVSLSRTEANDPVTIRHILRMLSDKDRLVREAGCLALGHLKAREAIGRLTHLWRNDVISHVREAAAVALHQIGGPEVEEVMRVTRVLAEEIRTLTEMKS